MLTEKQLRIFEVFTKRPFEEFTRSQIKKELNEKSNNALSIAINKLIVEKVISEKKVGNCGILRLNLNNDLTMCYITICNNSNLDREIVNCLVEINKEVLQITKFYSLVIFGSFSIGENKDGSDLDVAVFIENEKIRNRVEAYINRVKLRSLIKIDAHIITKDELLEMLNNKEENLGKQIARKHLAITNVRIFYEIVKEGIKNGFNLSSISGKIIE